MKVENASQTDISKVLLLCSWCDKHAKYKITDKDNYIDYACKEHVRTWGFSDWGIGKIEKIN